MGTVYVSQNDSFIGKTDERLTVRFEKKTLLDVPLIKMDGVFVLGRATVSPAALIELLERKIPLTFLTGTGRYLGSLEPPLTKNIFVRSAQWNAAKVKREKAVHVVRVCAGEVEELSDCVAAGAAGGDEDGFFGGY